MHGFDIQVIPLVFEHFGKWGSGAIDFMKSLGDRSTDDFGRKTRQNSCPIGEDALELLSRGLTHK